LDRIKTTAMTAKRIPKNGEPMEANLGAGLLNVLEPEMEDMAYPF
jgi:hypothetical protein